MMTASAFEIRVALIGYVSVGKTTILNALLRDKYSEVSMKRTTAGINLFRISAKPQPKGTAAGPGEWSAADHRTPDSTLREITTDNQTLRDANVLQEKIFDIELDEPLVEMKDETKLTLIDVPGINEAGASTQYKDYVEKNWHTFDCAIIVLDGRQGVNTEEQVKLLQLAQIKCEEVKNVPLIVLLNKIDDPDDEEQQVLVDEARTAVERMFQVSDRVKALQAIVAGKAASPERSRGYSPIVIPISAVQGYIYRTASSLSFEQFKKKIDKNLIEKLGREAYGRRWKRLSPQQKAQKAYEVIQDKDQYQDGLEESKFDQFLIALAFCVGGPNTQEWLIRRQVEVSTKRLAPEMDFVAELESLHQMCVKLGRPVDFVWTRFRQLHTESVEMAFGKLTSPETVHHLAKPMQEIIVFARFVRRVALADVAMEKIVNHARPIVLRLVDGVLQRKQLEKDRSVSSFEWTLIYSSMVGLCHSQWFEEYFGTAHVLLEIKFQDAMLERREATVTHRKCPKCLTEVGSADRCNGCDVYLVDEQPSKCHQSKCGRHNYNFDQSTGRCSGCHWYTQKAVVTGPGKDPLAHHYADGNLVASDADIYGEYVKFKVPDSPSDPHHFGHVIWLFGRLIEESSK